MQVSPDTQLFIVGDLNDARITISLTEQMLGYIHTGQRAVIKSESMTDQCCRRGSLAEYRRFLAWEASARKQKLTWKISVIFFCPECL